MTSKLLSFADSCSDRNSFFGLLGVPFDRTCSFRPGTRFGPNAVREASYNYETFMIEYGVDLADIPVYDAGDMEEFGHVDDMVKEVESEWDNLLKTVEFPITVGGEHSITPPCVKAFAKKMKKKGKRVCVLHIDAHLDYRAEYLGLKNSHACALRRNSEIVGTENLAAIGIRSVSGDEYEDAVKDRILFITSFELHRITTSRDGTLYKGLLDLPAGLENASHEMRLKAAVEQCIEHFRLSNLKECKSTKSKTNSTIETDHRGKLENCTGKRKHIKKNNDVVNNDFVIYLTLDIDGLDMAYAPGTGTPDPMGLSIWDLKYIIQELTPYLGGFDIVEVDPLSDRNTAALGARIIREVVASVWHYKQVG